MNYLVDKKVFEYILGDENAASTRFEAYMGEVIDLRSAFASAYLKDKGIPEDLIYEYFDHQAKELEESTEQDSGSEGVSNFDTDQEAGKPSDFTEIEKHINSDDFYVQVQELTNAFNKSIYDNARTGMTQESKDRLNNYLSEVEKERKKLGQEMLIDIQSIESLDSSGGLSASQHEPVVAPVVQPPVSTIVSPTEQVLHLTADSLPVAPTAIDPMAAATPVPNANANTTTNGLPPIDPIAPVGDAGQAGVASGVAGLPGATVVPDANANPMKPIDTYPAV